MRSLGYLLIGIFFGITMFKSEAASWFRIYEMFKFDAFHMYGIIGTAVGIGVVMVWVIKRYRIRSFYGTPITFDNKETKVVRYAMGGLIFGLGWGLAGACPGPIFTLAGAGYLPILVVLAAAILGTFVYGLLRDKLPH